MRKVMEVIKWVSDRAMATVLVLREDILWLIWGMWQKLAAVFMKDNAIMTR